MRKWNGIHVSDKVLYKNKEYIVKELYIENDEGKCDLLECENEEILKGILITECIKI